MALNDILSAAALKLGLKDTQIGTLRKKQGELAESIRRNHELLESFKRQVVGIDKQLASKKREYDAAGPGVKRIVKEEIRALFAQQDRIMEPVSAIADRIRQDELLSHKIGILIFAAENPTRTEEIEDLTDDMKDWLDEQREQSKAADELDGAMYSQKETDAKLDSRLNAIGGEVETAGKAVTDPLDERIAELG